MKGRKPIPTTLKILRGNPGKRKLNTNEAAPLTKRPRRPDFLTGTAADAWDKLVAHLFGLGLLTAGDEIGLSAVCQCYSRWREAESQVATLGAVVKGPGGSAVLNPWLSAANTSLKQLQALLVEFGLTPSSRSRISLPAMDKA